MDGGWSMSLGVADTEDMEAVQTFPFVPLSPSLFLISSLDLGPVQMASAQVFTTSGGGVSPCTGFGERMPLNYTIRLWDIWVGTIAYIEWLFDYSLSFPFVSFSCTGCGSPGGVHLKRGII